MKVRKASILFAGAAFFAGAAVSAAAAEEAQIGTTFLLPLAQGVQVHRGVAEDSAGFEAATRTESEGVTVIRGPAIDHQPPSPDLESQARFGRMQVTAGEDLWFYDPLDETVSACRLFKTFKVSAYRIRCFQRRVKF